jgi:hypothetical protein
MTKSELRKARKEAIENGQKLVGELAIKQNSTASSRTINRKSSRLRKKQREQREQAVTN